MTHLLYTAASWLSKPSGFYAVHLTMVGFGLWGMWAGFDEHWSLIFTLYLSIIAISIGMMVLTAQRRDGLAVHAKLDSLIVAVEKADNRLVRAEEATEEEIESRRQ